MPSERLVRSSESITEPSGELLGSIGGLVESSESMIGPSWRVGKVLWEHDRASGGLVGSSNF